MRHDYFPALSNDIQMCAGKHTPCTKHCKQTLTWHS